MTELIINVVNVAGETDLNDRVRLWPPYHRADGGRVVSTAAVDVPLVDGYATVDVLPGPARVQVIAGGVMDTKPRPVMVPDAASVTLRALMEDSFEWEPEIVSQVSLDAQRAEDAAVRAEGVADAFGSLEGVVDQVQAASDAAVSASGSASAASSSASAAATSESNAAGSATSADSSASAAASSASAAASSASAATEAADNAAGSESQAASSASAAASSASVADSAATRAEDVADSTHWQDDRLSVMGQLGPSLKGPKGDKGDKGDSGDGAGDVLWSELNLVLDGKASVSHDHTIGQVTGLQSALDGKSDKSDATVAMVAGKIVQREPDSPNIRVSEAPQQPYHAAARSYVDTEVGKKANASRVTALEDNQPIIVSSMDPSPMPGRIYLVTG